MQLQKIEKDNWTSFLEAFNRKHKNRFFNLEEIEGKGDKNILVENVRLKDVSVDIEKGEYNNTAIISGNTPDTEINHFVIRTKNISVEKNDEGTDEELYFESDEGKTTVLSFKLSVPQDQLDGIA